MTPLTQPRDVDRWDGEGGSQLASMAQACAIEDLEETDRRILAFLGVSVLGLWDDLPDNAKQKLLNGEAAQAAFDKATIKGKLARMLDDADAARGRPAK